MSQPTRNEVLDGLARCAEGIIADLAIGRPDWAASSAEFAHEATKLLWPQIEAAEYEAYEAEVYARAERDLEHARATGQYIPSPED